MGELSIFEKLVLLKPGKGFGITLIGGSLPILASLINGLDSPTLDWGFLRTSDIVFLGLTFNVSSLNVAGSNPTVDGKWGIMFWSFFLMFILTLCLGRIYTKASETEIAILLKSTAYAIVAVSLFVGLVAHRRIDKTA